MRAVNLLPRDVQNTGSGGGRKPLLVVAGGIAAVTAASAVMVLSASGSVADQRSQLRSVEDAIARIPAKESPAVALGVITQERTERTAALSAALATRVSMDRLLREVAYVLPQDAWLTALSATVSPSTAAAPGTPSPTTAQGVSIVGATYSHSSVARVLSRLAAVPSLDDVRLTGSARVVLSTPVASQSTSTSKSKSMFRSKSVVTFTISANVRRSTA